MLAITVGYETHAEHVAWSAGVCPQCQQVEALRLENLVRRWSICFVPVSTEIVGGVSRCDVCEQLVPSVVSDEVVSLSDWSREQGLAPLLAQLLPGAQYEVPKVNLDARIHSILRCADVASDWKNGPLAVGLTLGMIVGVGGGLLLAHYQMARQNIQLFEERLGPYFYNGVFLGVAGMIVGSLAQKLLFRTSAARRQILSICTRYPVDMFRMEELAVNYGPLVMRAVRGAREKTGR